LHQIGTPPEEKKGEKRAALAWRIPPLDFSSAAFLAHPTKKRGRERISASFLFL